VAAFPYRDDPAGRLVVLLHSHTGEAEAIRCYDASVGAGGVLVVRIYRSDRSPIYLSPLAWSVASIAPAAAVTTQRAGAGESEHARGEGGGGAAGAASARGGPPPRPQDPPSDNSDPSPKNTDLTSRKAPNKRGRAVREADELGDDDSDEGFIGSDGA